MHGVISLPDATSYDNLCFKTFRYETVNIHLRSKPEWFAKDINPLGKVPTLQIDDKIVYDSEICNEYIDETYPGDENAPRDPYQRAKDRMLLEHFPKVIYLYKAGMILFAQETKIR